MKSKKDPKKKALASKAEAVAPETTALVEPSVTSDPDEVVELEVVPDEEDSESEEAEPLTVFGSDDDIEVIEEVPESEPASKSRALVPYSPLDAYLQEIRRFTPLSKEEEHEVAVRYQTHKDPEAAYRLVSGNLWLVVKIARDYERVARNVLDLIQEGNIGLMEAVKNFDPYRGVRFPSYAVWWIKAYIIRYIIANWRLVKIGTTQAQRKLFFNLKKESDRLEREGIRPTPKLLAEKLNVREGDIVEMSQRLSAPDVSVDAPLQDDSDSSLLSVLPNGQISAEEQVARQQMRDLLVRSVEEFKSKLSDKERLILDKRVLDEDKETLQELADRLLLSKERIRQIENKLRERLKTFIADRAGSELEEWLGLRTAD